MNKKWISMALAMGILVTNLPMVNTFAEEIKSTSIEGTTTEGTGNITTDTFGTTTDTVGQDKVDITTVTTDTTGTTKVEDSTSTAGEEKIDNSDFVFDKGTGTIILYKGNAKVLTIPSEIDGVAVKILSSRIYYYFMGEGEHLGMFTDQNRDNIEKVIIPSSVESIHDLTFENCSNLKEVKLSEGLKKIGDFVFYKTALEKINIPSSVIEVGRGCVYCTPWEKSNMDNNNGFLIINNSIHGYKGDDEILKIPDGIKMIIGEEDNSFWYSHNKIKEVLVPESVILIKGRCFYHQYGPVSINIANPNVEIEKDCFNYSCVESDLAITIAGKVVSQAQINNSKFDFDKSTGTITGYKGNEKTLYIPSEIDGVPVLNIEASPQLKAKGYGILGDNLTVSSIIINSTQLSIKSGAFQNSINLQCLDIREEAMHLIESGSFQGCINLSSVLYLHSFFGDTDLDTDVLYKDEYKDAFKDTEWQLEGAIATNTLVAAAEDTADGNNVFLAMIMTILSGVFLYKSYQKKKISR